MTPTFPWVSLFIVYFMALLLYYNDPNLSLSQSVYCLLYGFTFVL